MKPILAVLPADFRSTFLDGLTPREKKSVLKAARQVRIAPDQVLQHEGDAAKRLWLVVKGRVAVYRLASNGDKLFLRWGTGGDTFGLSTILKAPAHYLVTIEAVQESTILTWNLASCQGLVLQFPNLSKVVTLVAADYIADLTDVLGMCQLKSAEQRLAHVIIKSANQLGRDGREGTLVDLTNEELALASHMSVFTVSRNLNKWQNLGILKKYRGKVVLPSLAPFKTITKETWDKSASRTLRPAPFAPEMVQMR